MSSNAEPEKVKQCNADGDDDSRPQDSWSANCLVPATGKIEERRTGGDRGHGEDGNKHKNRDEAKKSFESYSDKGSNGVTAHYFLFENELRGSAAQRGVLVVFWPWREARNSVGLTRFVQIV